MKFIIIFVLCANILMRLGRLKVNFASAFGFFSVFAMFNY